jgi:hypothetical protein
MLSSAVLEGLGDRPMCYASQVSDADLVDFLSLAETQQRPLVLGD